MGWLDSIKDKKEKDAAQVVLKMIPDELKDKSAEEITALLKEAPSLKIKLAETEAARAVDADKVTKISTEFELVKTRLAAAEANRTPPKGQEEEPANFVEEPDKAFSQRIGPLATITLQNAAQTARMLAQQELDNNDMASENKTMDGRLFRAWGAELNAESRKYRTDQLATPQAWLGIFYYLKGTHADELRDPETRKKKYNFLEPSNTQVVRQTEEKKTPSDQLTAEEKHVADKMGVSYENYLKRKKSMQYDSA
jgi:hypothetical protein